MNTIVGRKIVAVRPITQGEVDREGWSDWGRLNVPVIVLDDGAILFPSRDEEGNGPGEIFGFKDGEGLFLFPSGELE